MAVESCLPPAPDRSLNIMDSPVVTDTDLISATIVGCPQAGPGIKPCFKIVFIMTGRGIQIQTDGETPILESLQALTDGNPPGIVSALDNGQSNATPGTIAMSSQALALVAAAASGAPFCAVCAASAITAVVKPDNPGLPLASAPTAPCPAAIIKNKLNACDRGTKLWAEAKQALGKDPIVQVGKVDGGFEANTQVTTGVITIAPTSDCCAAVASLFFELTNARSKARHLAVDADAAAGNVSREEYARREARVEYDGVLLLKSTFDKCRKAWGCAAAATSGYENVSSDFGKYYASTTEDYKDYYRKAWDSDYKKAYEGKHP